MIWIDIDMPRCCIDCSLEFIQNDEGELTHRCIVLYTKSTDEIRRYGRLEECPLRERNR